MSTATATHTFRKGDRIIVDPNGIGVAPAVIGRVFVVDRVNPKNVVAKPEGGGRGINYPKDLLLPAPDGEAPGAAVLIPYVPPVFHDTGAIVTCDQDLRLRGGATWVKGTPLVVFKCDGDKSNVTVLGGDPRGTYFRVPVARLTVRDTAWLAEHLVSTL